MKVHKKNSGVALWNKATKIIPGGNQLLSKRSERFLPGIWPAYYKKAKGCEIWDLDDNHYYDFSMMGIGTGVLGYADDDVNEAVIEAIRNGSNTTLNSYEEVDLAEKLTELHPWSDMVRFTRGGGEACSVAVRIARAASGKDKIAFCGYHGWHDWYLAANLADSTNLDEQLLPGLSPKGVPRILKGSAIPFNYNKIEELEKIVDENKSQIGVIIMEPRREIEPKNDFLRKVRDIADNIDAVLIFDEVTSGFRMNLGGIHLNYNIYPDLAVFGKALGNGFPIAAVIGRKEFMDKAQDSFISSTFWTERIGFTAALATISKMEKYNVFSKLIKYGEDIINGWLNIANNNNIDIKISGIPSQIHISFKYNNALAIDTLFTQEMLLRGYLAGTQIYTTLKYSDKIISNYLQTLDEVLYIIKSAINEKNVESKLIGGVRTPHFVRLTD